MAADADIDASTPALPEAGATIQPGDNCSIGSLLRLRVLDVAQAPIAFAVDVGMFTNTFFSSCSRAEGPDAIEVLTPKVSGRLLVEITSTDQFIGDPVVYAKATCDNVADLACSASRSITFAVTANTSYYVHFDGLLRTQVPEAKLFVRARVLVP